MSRERFDGWRFYNEPELDETADDEDGSCGDLNQCPECGDNLDFSEDDDGFCWSCDI